MWPLLILSIVALAVIVERLMVLLSARTDVEAFMARVENALIADRYDEAVTVAREGGGVMGRILLAGLEKMHKGRLEVERAIETRGNIEVSRLEKGLSLLQAVAKTAPLIGFFGTVAGMIGSFEAMGQAGASGDPAQVALGISQALITTAGGLAVAIPVFFCHSLFVGKVNRFVMELEESSVRLLDALEVAEAKQAERLSLSEIGGEYLEI